MTKPNRITVHCSDTPNNRAVRSETILKWHKKRGFRTIGYHAVVHVDGSVDCRASKDFFRGLNEPGAHVRGHNEGNIGICLIGRNRFKWDQFWALKELCKKYSQSFGIGYNNIWCHYEMSSHKTCPNIRNADLISFIMSGDKKYILDYLIMR